MAQRKAAPQIGLVMGSDSDWDVMKHAAAQLEAFGVPLRGARPFGAPDARRNVRIRRGRGPAGPARDHRRRRRRCAPARHARREDHRAGPGRSGPVEIPARRGLAAVDRADADGHSGRDFRDRRSGRRPTPRCSPSRCSPPAIPRLRGSSPRSGQADDDRACDACSAAREHVRRRVLHRPSRRAPGSGCSAEDSSAACSAWRRKASATASPCSTRRATALRAASPTGTSWPTISIRGACCSCARCAQPRPPSSKTCRRRRSSSSPANARVTPGAASVAIAQDRISEKTFLAGHGFAVAPFAVLRDRAGAATARRGAAAGHREERALRLRRQGSGPRARAATTSTAAFDAMAGECVRARADARPAHASCR